MLASVKYEILDLVFDATELTIKSELSVYRLFGVQIALQYSTGL